MYVYLPHLWPEPGEARRGHWIPGTGVIDGWNVPCKWRELDLWPLQCQPVPLLAEPSLQPHVITFLFLFFYHIFCSHKSSLLEFVCSLTTKWCEMGRSEERTWGGVRRHHSFWKPLVYLPLFLKITGKEHDLSFKLFTTSASPTLEALAKQRTQDGVCTQLFRRFSSFLTKDWKYYIIICISRKAHA